MLKETFTALLQHYAAGNNLANELWNEIEQSYSAQSRHYHTLKHLDNLLQQLTEVKPDIKHWDTILFTLYYHDIVYNAAKSDNEEKSAELAVKRMNLVSASPEVIERCKNQILATKQHVENADPDTNYFLDADLSILGQPWEVYADYYKNVRKEYSIYPALIYNPGRKKVLRHFLTMDRIFKTDHFFRKFDQPARQNLQKEIDLL